MLETAPSQDAGPDAGAYSTIYPPLLSVFRCVWGVFVVCCLFPQVGFHVVWGRMFSPVAIPGFCALPVSFLKLVEC